MGVFLDKYKIKEEEEEKPFSFLDKYKFTAEAGIGAKADMGVTLPKPTPLEPLETPGISQRMRGIGEAPKEFELEAPLAKLPETGKKIVQMLGGLQGFKATEPETYKQINDISKAINDQPDKLSRIAKAHELLTGESIKQSLKEMGKPTLQPWEKTGLTYKIGVGEIEHIKLPKKFDQAQGLAHQAMQFSTSGKIGDVMRTVAQDVVLGYLVTVGLKGLYQSGLRVEDTWISGKKLEAAMKRAQKAYIVETGKFKATLSNSDLAIVKAVQRISRITGVEAGKIAGVKVPQQVFMGQAGEITNLVKMIQNKGKLTPDITNQLKVMNPVDTGLVFQQLSIASPAIAEKIASEFVKLIPQEIKKIPKAEEEMTPEEAEAFERLKKEEIVPIEEVEPTKVELEAIEKPITPKKEFEEAFKVAKEPEKVVYRASAKPYDEKLAGEEGIYVWKDKARADEWAKTQKYPNVEKFTISKDAKILKQSDIPKVYTKTINGKTIVDDQIGLIKYAKEKGYDGIEDGGEYVIWNQSKITKAPEKITQDLAEKVEVEPEPTPEEIKTVFMEEKNLETTVENRELFYEKYNKIYTETKKGYDKLIDAQVAILKEEGFKGVDRGGLKRTEEGEVVGAYPSISKNPKWYRDFYAREKKAPSNKDLKEIAKEHLSKGHTEDYGEISPNEIFVKIESQLDSYETILSDIKGGDYSFETPKNVEKLNEKLKEMKSVNERIVKNLEKELTVLKAERELEYKGLKAEVEAGKRIEIEIGVKKGVKEVVTGKKFKGLSEEEIKQGNQLMGQINKIADSKGLTKVEFTALKSKYGYSPHLATKTKRMSIPQLEAVLKGVQRARPKIIRHMQVIKPKTEGKIQSLKDNLIDKYQMTEEVYQEVLKDLGVYKEPKYIDGQHFITEQKGKEIIYRLIDEANILKVTNPFLRAVAENKEASANVDKINKKLKAIVDRGLRDPHELTSMRLYFQTMETITGAPFFPLYQDLINAHLENKQKTGRRIKELQPYDEIIKDEKELKKVNDYILSKSNLKGRPETPKNITEKEIRLSDKIEDILEGYEARARTEKFLDNIDHPEDMPQYLEFKKEIDKAKDIYESKGYDDLVEYMKDQKFGVIKSGYSPLQVLTPKVRIYKPPPQAFGKGPIKVRTDIEYHEQDRDIIQRLLTYEKQMNNLVVMRPKIKALITLIDKNVSKFKDPDKIAKNIGVFFKELKGYNRPENWWDRGLNRLYAQAMQTIILPSPVLSFRNLLQNIAFGHDKSILIDPRNKNMTKEELAYFDTYISQLESMNIDWFQTGEKPLPGMVWLTKMVKKISIYPYSDLANRHWGYWAKMNEVKRVFARDKSLDQKMKAAKFGDMELIEQKMALQILAKDGQEAMAQYVSRVYVDNTQFLYDRSQRSLTEMGRFGRVAGNLMLFPRAYWEMLYKQSRKMGGKYVSGRERVRAFKVLAAVIGGGILVGAAFKKVTGRKENPYDPLRLLAYEPGGLALGTTEAVTDLYVNIIDASKGLDKALATASTTIPHATDMFIPFYAYTIRALEASTDTKNIDRKAIRKLREIINKEYQIRGGAYIVERNAMEKWQYFLSGAGVDVTIKEREAKKKKEPVSPYLEKYKLKTTTPTKSTYLDKYR